MAKEAKKAKQKKPNRFKNALETVALRMSLLRIWFMKNLTFFLATVMVAILIIIATGCGHNLPLIGMFFKDVPPFWGVGNTFWENVLAVLGGLVTPCTACALILTKTRRISLNDIKSVKTKKAMIKAGLYFDKEGHLAKRKKGTPIETAKKECTHKPKMLSKALAPVKEFVLAITASVKDIDDVDKKAADENVDIGIANVEEKINETTFVEIMAPTLTAANELAQPTKETVEEEKAPVEDVPTITPMPTDEVPVIETPTSSEDVENMTDAEVDDYIADEQTSESDESRGGIILAIFAGIGAGLMAIGTAIRKLFFKTDEEKAIKAEKKAMRKAKKEERAKLREAKKAAIKAAKEAKDKVKAEAAEKKAKLKEKLLPAKPEPPVVEKPSQPATTGSVRRVRNVAQATQQQTTTTTTQTTTTTTTQTTSSVATTGTIRRRR